MARRSAKVFLLALAGLLAGVLLAVASRAFYPSLPADPATKLAVSLNASDPQLAPILNNLLNGKSADAARALLKIIQAHAANLPDTFLTPLPAWDTASRAEADAALAGTFTLQGVTGKAPAQSGGGFDWSWPGPNNDPEFAWFLNRQHHIPALFVAWRETKDSRYRAALNSQLRDWLRQCPRPAHYSFSSSWRALEVARRVEDAWMPVLFSPDASAAFDDDVLLGLLADIPDHAAALRYTHSFSGNHLITEMTGLASLALAFPQFKDAPAWFAYADKTALAEVDREIYPDGAETELSNLYQRVVLLELQRLAEIFAASDGRAGDYTTLRKKIEKAWNYFAHTLDPTGHGPLNNDSSVDDDAALARQMAVVYHRDDWLYVATNGREGVKPGNHPPTEYFPDAGLAIMRSGYDENSQWAFFLMGPRGSDHQHADQLQLSIGGMGREFLVDDGRYNYQPGPFRDYFTGPQGHNVLILDGNGSMPPPDVSATPANIDSHIADAAAHFSATVMFSGNVAAGQGPAYHTRTVDYVSGQYWLVTDTIQCAGPHKLECLWHFHPDCTVKRDGDILYTDDQGKPNFAMRVLDTPPGGWSCDFIRGRESPTPQGWYSPSFNVRLPATCASFSALVSHPATIRWLMRISPPGQDPRAGIAALFIDQSR